MLCAREPYSGFRSIRLVQDNPIRLIFYRKNGGMEVLEYFGRIRKLHEPGRLTQLPKTPERPKTILPAHLIPSIRQMAVLNRLSAHSNS